MSGVRPRIVRGTPRKHVVRIRIRIAKRRPAKCVLLLRIAKPAFLARRLSAPPRGARVALSMFPGELRLAVVAKGGSVAPAHRFSV